MAIGTIIILIVIFSVMAYISIKSSSNLKYLIPVLFVGLLACTYQGVNYLLGSARPYHSIFLGNLDINGTNITVLGGELTEKHILLLLKEDKTEVSKLYEFPPDREFRQKLNLMMIQHAVENGGEHWGFTMDISSSKGKRKINDNEEQTEFNVTSQADKKMKGGEASDVGGVKPTTYGTVTDYHVQ